MVSTFFELVAVLIVSYCERPYRSLEATYPLELSDDLWIGIPRALSSAMPPWHHAIHPSVKWQCVQSMLTLSRLILARPCQLLVDSIGGLTSSLLLLPGTR